PPAVLMAAADGRPSDAAVPDLFLPVPEQAFVRPFPRDEAVKPDVLAPFRERVPASVRNQFEAGVTALAAGDYSKAETSFKSAVQPDIETTSAMAYVGVTLALRDHDL